MNNTVIKIALAGLLHDIGKFAQGCMELSQTYRDNNASLYQPVYKGHYSHQHALYTAAFIEQYTNYFPQELSQREWGEGDLTDIFLNLAACHHNPSTPLQWIITIADRISSGLDRAAFEKGEAIAYQDVKKTRLLPIFEALGPDRHVNFQEVESFKYRYPLASLSVNSIFPVEVAKGQLDKKDAEQEYQVLFEQFINDLANLSHKNNIALWMQHLNSLLMVYTSMIPAARVGDVVHDVSLYDHCHTTAALAAALYLYHKQTDTLTEKAIQEDETPKFLLVAGDFFGIQDFIFSSGGESQGHRSKLLRGRSFAVSLFSELAADMLCKAIGLPMLSVVLNAAGKFHLIAPNTEAARKAIADVEQEINKWLFKISYGQSSMGITVTPATPTDFNSKRFLSLWDQHLQHMEQKKFQKIALDQYGGVIKDFLDQFDNSLHSPLCPLCGKRPSVKEAENNPLIYKDKKGSACAICRDHIMLGTYLVKGKRLAICDTSIRLKTDNRLFEPIFGAYQVTFVDSDDLMQGPAENGHLLKLWNLEITDDGNLDCSVTNRLINGHVPKYRNEDNFDNCLLEGKRSTEKTSELIEQIKDGVPKTFGHIAVKAKRWNDNEEKCYGTEAIGVLKADVDNLGMLFGCGLSNERFTISRLATMSRQLNNFFAIYLPHLLRTQNEFYDVYTVFAGGDDLFLIGPWNRMISLAIQLCERFAEYVAYNPDIHFSAGITLHKPNTPINAMAEAAEEAMEHSKNGGRNRVTIFNETVEWNVLNQLQGFKKEMEGWLSENLISHVMLYRFNYLIELAKQEKEILNREVKISFLECLKWRSLFRYSIARNINQKLKDDEREKAINKIAIMAKWLEEHGGAIRIPLWQILYEIRK
jgi:CRISPR-associated protein Csm1